MARIDSYRLPPRQAAAAYQAGELDESGLLRSVMTHRGWRVAAELDERERASIQTTVAPSGHQILEVFSDDEAVVTFSKKESQPRPKTMVQIPGFSLFGQLEVAEIGRVNFDLHSPHRFYYEPSAFETLRGWAEIGLLETALLEPDEVGDPMAILRNHPAYAMVARRTSQGSELVLAPDTEDRALAAVFTAEDAADEFCANLAAQIGDADILRYDGDALFQTLQGMPIEGVVFNPMTHLTPRALSRGVFAQVLEARKVEREETSA